MNLYDFFKELNIQYKEIEHDPVYTIEQARFIHEEIAGVGCKNLFLKNKKDQFFLLLTCENKKVNFKSFEKQIQSSHISFCDTKKLKELLNLEPGSVSPFGILYDTEHKVHLYIDSDLQNKTILFHPNQNTKTISIYYNDLIRFIEHTHHLYDVIKF